MALVHSPKIVTDNLVFFLDAGNTKSYNYNSYTGSAVDGQTLYNSSGTHTFEVPPGITQISAACLGGGGGGGASTASEDGGGGGGGGLAYGTIDVTPLEELTVITGAGGANGGDTSDGGDGGDSQIKRGDTVLLQGGGGGGGEYTTSGNGAGGEGGGSSGTSRIGGGSGGDGGTGVSAGGGGGGAAGYSGNGGNGCGTDLCTGEDGSGGGGGGGGGNENSGGLGGGIQIYGEHDPVENGEGSTAAQNAEPGSGGVGQSYGGGGKGDGADSGISQSGSVGIVRIVYKLPNDVTRVYPLKSNVDNITYNNLTNDWIDMMGVNNGTLTNGPTFSNDNGGSIVFDGDDDKVELGSIDSSNVLSLNDPAGGGLTISFAINWTQAGDNYPRIIDKGSGSNALNGWAVYISRTGGAVGGMNIIVNDSGNGAGQDYNLGSSSNVTPDTWEIWTFTHVKATDGAWVWYKNGISDNSGTETYAIPTTTTDARIGSWYSTAREYKGKIGFVNVYDRVLSAAEVKQNFDAVKRRYGL